MADLDLERLGAGGFFHEEIEAMKAEIRRLREERDMLQHAVDHKNKRLEAIMEERERYRFALQLISAVRRGVEVTDTLEERLDYWSAMALAYRRAAEEALNPPEGT